jgi:hypothetical protein
MTGVNQLTLCEAEVKKAVQYYFDHVLFRDGQAPRVVSADVERHAQGVFDVTVGVDDSKRGK